MAARDADETTGTYGVEASLAVPRNAAAMMSADGYEGGIARAVMQDIGMYLTLSVRVHALERSAAARREARVDYVCVGVGMPVTALAFRFF